MINYTYEIYTRKNTMAVDKPNEDLAVFDDTLGIGMVLDGVTRDRENGKYVNPSPAEMASRLFSETALKVAKESRESEIVMIQSMICSGNETLKKYNDRLKHRFPAGTVGIVFAIRNDRFFYGYIGDCYAAIIRNGMMRVFTEIQTAMVSAHKKEFSSDEIRFNICNHISHPCGYGVLDGNDSAIDFVKYGSIGLLKDDVLLIYSDGMQKSVKDRSINDLIKLPLESINCEDIDNAQDDSTCIKIIF